MDRETPNNPYEAIGYGDFGSYFKNKKIKLQIQQDEIAALVEEDLPQIFDGVIVYVNGYTDPPIHGGEFTQFLHKSKITHIIASNLTQSKMKEFRNYKVAKPEWVTESVKANRLLPWHNFSTIRIPGSLTQFRSGSEATQSGLAPSSASVESPGNTKSERGSSPYQTQTRPEAELIHKDSHRESHHTHMPDIAPPRNDTVMEDSVEVDNSNDLEVMQDIHEAETCAALEDMDGEDSFFEGLDLDEFEYQPTPPNAEVSSNELPSANVTDSESSFQPFTQVPVSPPSEQLSQYQPQLMDPPKIPASGYKPLAFNPYTRAGLPSMMPIPDSNNTIKTMEVIGTQVETDPQDDRHPTLIELSVPWNRQNCSIQPGFVEKFYQSSRLHYLSTWKAKLRDVTTKLQKDRPVVVNKSVHKTIMHIDFDCFFASVATRGKPELQVKPIAVAHGTGGSTSNSEIASCNYLARDFGVKNGMQLLKARTLCPDLLVVPYEFQQYEDISIEFYKILLGYADELQAVSVDEALVDISSKCLPTWDSGVKGSQLNASGGTQNDGGSRMTPAEFALKVREEIFLATGCHASVGIGPNILLAKLSTKRAKPHGQFIWPSPPGSIRTLEELQGAVPDLIEESDEDSSPPVSGNTSYSQSYEPPPVVRKSISRKEPVVKDLPGVGYKISQDLLERLNVRTLHQLQQAGRDELQRICGMKTGDLLYNSCRGIDETTIASDREKSRQSVSAEISWGVRFENNHQVDVFMRDLSQEVSKRLKEIDRKGKSIVMKIMKRKEFVKGHWKHLGHGPVDQFARTGQLPLYTDDPDLIANEALKLLNFFKFNVLDLRGLGIQVLKLNNEVVNTVSKSAFVLPDSMNQTTLTSAMFQQKPKSATAPLNLQQTLEHAEPSSHPHPTPGQDPPPPAPVEQGRSEPEKPTMEIDSGTFKELPKDIQEELLRDHKLVFVDQDDANNNGRACTTENGGAMNEQQGGKKNELPPWSQLDPIELMALSTPVMRDALKEYAEIKKHGRGPSNKLPATPATTSKQPTATITTTRPGLEEDDHLLGNSVLPAPSKLDRSVLQALPPEIRAEIEQEYTHIMENHELIRKLGQFGGSGTGEGGGGAGFQLGPLSTAATVATNHYHDHPQDQGPSRAKNRGRGGTRGRPRGSRTRGRGRGRGAQVSHDHLDRVDDPQNNGFTDTTAAHAQQQQQHHSKTAKPSSEVPALDADFLAALPEDIRAEVEAAHRVEMIKNQRRQEAELAAQRDAAAASRQGYSGSGANDLQKGASGGPMLERPTLMGKREIGDLRVLLTQWVQSSLVEQDLHRLRKKDDCRGEMGGRDAGAVETVMYDEGPNPEDVQSFVDFVARVIVMERDLERVQLLLRFLRRRIEDNERQVEPVEMKPLLKGVKLLPQVTMSWRQALDWVLHVARQLVLQVYGGSFDID
ncbi:deoxycytidyl transferase [Linnemannia exigua]|uniref:DNA repair protein REV1 n=1 Tax=Linnemannia exigua TaxID=604196 RepID=A0AAD4DBZ2_9FUNG|nr:deoxycytidyl transferase [Linnemannia exigua]